MTTALELPQKDATTTKDCKGNFFTSTVMGTEIKNLKPLFSVFVKMKMKLYITEVFNKSCQERIPEIF